MEAEPAGLTEKQVDAWRQRGRTFPYSEKDCYDHGDHSWGNQWRQSHSDSIRCHWCGAWKEPLLQMVQEALRDTR